MLKSILDDFCREHKVGDYAYTEKLQAQTYERFEHWVQLGYSAELKYLQDHRKSMRENLKKYFPDAQSALVFLFPYQKHKSEKNTAGFLSGFSDEDYHFILGKKLQLLGESLQASLPGLEFKLALDMHPVLDRDLAYRAGLGFFGKNSMLIHPKLGSFFMIGSLILSQCLEHEQREVMQEFCGKCEACLKSCPTQALVAPKILDAKKCVSYFTLEVFKEGVAPKGAENGNYFLGCDTCQDVCPWNKKHLRRSEQNRWETYFSRPLSVLIEEIQNHSNKTYQAFFKRTGFERMGKRGMLKNLNLIQERLKKREPRD